MAGLFRRRARRGCEDEYGGEDEHAPPGGVPCGRILVWRSFDPVPSPFDLDETLGLAAVLHQPPDPSSATVIPAGSATTSMAASRIVTASVRPSGLKLG